MDVMDYLIEDEETRVIAVFLETIRNPTIFKRIAQKALERKKPIVALKVGRSEISARAAKAHTGALVGNDAIHDAIFQQLGIIRVKTLVRPAAALARFCSPNRARAAAGLTGVFNHP